MVEHCNVIIAIVIVIALSLLLIRSEYKHRYRTFRKNMQRVKLLQETEQVTTTSKDSDSFRHL